MKILDFVPYYRPHIGGLEKFAEELHFHLTQSGETIITVYTPNLPPSIEYEQSQHIEIIRYPAFELVHNYPFPKFWKKSFWEQLRKISSRDYDIVFSTSRFFLLSVIADVWARIHRKKRVLIEHGSDHVTSTPFITIAARIYDYTFGWWAIKGADRVVTASASASRFVQKLTGLTAPVIYRGMPFEEIEAIAPQSDLHEQYPQKIVITYLGRLIHGKGVQVLLEAIEKIPRTDFVLLIVGDGPEMENLRNQTTKCELTSKVQFLGSQPFDKAMSILKASDIFVNPSFNEGLPTSVLEAAACGTPIVATYVGGTPEIVENESSALLVPPNDVPALTKVLERALSDETLRESLSKKALAQVKEKFQWEKNVASYRKIITELTTK